MKTALVFIFSLAAFSTVCAQQWKPLGSGVSGPEFEASVVERLVVIDDKLYACGYFNNAGDIEAWSVAYWDGSKWQTHAAGVPDSTAGVYDVIKFENKILAFYSWGGTELITAWTGASWENFPSTGLGISNFTSDAEVHKNQLYLAQDAEGVLRFNGTSWDKLPGSVLIESPRALASFQDDLYIGAANGLFKYNGSEVQQVWGLANIYGLKVLDNMLYMTGAYLGHIGADSMAGVAMYDGTKPISLGTPIAVDLTEFSEIIHDVTKVGNKLVASGDIHDEIFGYTKILAYDGSWQTIGVADYTVKSLATIGNTVYIGGYFFNIYNQPFSNVASIDIAAATPGIRGHVFLDLNNNCQRDPNDKLLSGHLVRAMPGPYYATTEGDGSYVLFVEPGTYTITASPLTYANNCSPESYTIKDSASNVDFGFKSIDDTARVQPVIAAGRYVAGRKNTIVILVTNVSGVAATNVGVRLQLSANLNFLSSDHAYQQTGPQEYLFTIPSIPPQDYERIIVIDSVNVGALGEYAHVRAFSFVGTSFGEDEDLALILGPHDPNEKLVASQNEGAYVVEDSIEAGDMLTYKINFQNVGTDTAYQVIIRDTISPLLDLSTFQTLAATHAYKVDVGSNFITWTFDDIKLPDSSANQHESNGGLRYQIKQIPGNTPGTVITNSAAIYFDFNPPVITNETRNIIALPSSVLQHAEFLALTVYPNPAATSVTVGVGLPDGSARIVVYSLEGKEVYSTTASLPASIDMRAFESGVYTIQVKLKNGITYLGKLILE